MGRPDPRGSAESDADPRERVLAPVRAAREQVETERAEVVAERRAIEAFIDRVESLPTASRPRTGGHDPEAGTVVAGANVPGADLSTVRSAYRETVMAVDHYESVYGDDLPESLAAEFGPELAVTVGDGSGGALTPQLRRALLDAAGESRDDRTAFVDTLDGEAASLRAAEAAFEELLGRLDGSGAGDGPANANGVVDRLDTLAAGRQERLNRRPGRSRTDGHDLCSYLYADAGWTYPVLAGVARFRAGLGAEE